MSLIGPRRASQPCSMQYEKAPRLSNQRPGEQAAAVIKGLANSQNNPQLAEGLDGPWRRKQIAAVVREIFRSHDLDNWSDPPDPDASVRSPLNPKPHPRSGAARVFPN